MKRTTHERFLINLEKTQPELFKSIKIIGKYEHLRKPILIKNKYGECFSIPSNLLLGAVPSIKSAVNPTEYFINHAREVHGDLYDYSCVDYKHTRIKVKIIGSEGEFWQTPHGHLAGNGCPLLGNLKVSKIQQENPSNNYQDSEYIKCALKSKHFDSFKVYVIKCWNDDESEVFYKIGKTFNNFKRRFDSNTKMPYNYEVIEELTFDKSEEGGLECCLKERELQAKNKEFKYLPKIKFGGMYECFSRIN